MTLMTSKEELLRQIKVGKDALEATLAALDDERMIEGGAVDEWAVKDVLAHITAWERRMLLWLGDALRGQEPEMPAPGRTWRDVEELNQEAFLEKKEVSLEQIRSEFEGTYREMLDLLESAPETVLLDADAFEWMAGSSFAKIVAACTFEHYIGHAEAIRSWLEL